MKKKLFSFLFALMASVGTMVAEVYSGSCGDNVTWSLNTNDSTMIISGTGPMADFTAFTQPWKSYVQYIKHAVISEGVTHIGEESFWECTAMESVTIPSSVTSISPSFGKCDNLKRVHISDIAAWCNISYKLYGYNPLSYAHHLYLNDVEITNLVIPSNVTKIGNGVFTNCFGITSVTISNGTTVIGNEAFLACENLTSVIIPNTIDSIGDYAFCKTGITNITIPNSVKSIGQLAFSNCPNLTGITIPASVTNIGAGAFSFCKNLSSIIVDNNNPAYTSVDGIIYNKNLTALIQCTANKVGSVVIPNSVTSIEDYAFNECVGLTNITVPDGVVSIGQRAFSGSGVTNMTIPNSVTSIGASAFSFCEELTSIVISNSVTSIELYTFEDCSKLTSITLGNAITSIGLRAFFGCSSLASIAIPSGVIEFGELVFAECTNLTSIYNYAVTPQNISQWVFYNFNKSTCTLYVPEESVSLYKNANEWRDFNPILPINTENLEGTMADNNRSVKTIRDGQLIIQRDDKVYTVTGQKLQ